MAVPLRLFYVNSIPLNKLSINYITPNPFSSLNIENTKNPCKWHSHTIHKGFFLQNNQANFALCIHLLRNLFRKVLFLLLKALACLEADKSLNGKIRTILLGNLFDILRYRLLAILSFNVYLL